MWFQKRNYKEEYREVLIFLESKKEEIELIQDLKVYHEDVIRGIHSNPIKAMIQFYFDDMKLAYQYMKFSIDEVKQKQEQRIWADELAILELQKLEPIYQEIMYYENLKICLEQKLKKEEILRLKAEVFSENHGIKR